LSSLFPSVLFLLVDPAPFDISPTAKFMILEDFMTANIASDYKTMKTLLISDIRSGDHRVLNENELEEAIKADMNNQMLWYQILAPKAALLKFRLPWNDEKSEYLDGTLYLPVFGPQTTTECRLLVTENKMRVYDNKQYEEQMFYFNKVTRPSYYPHSFPYKEYLGIDHCYDCTCELLIIKTYILSSIERLSPWLTHRSHILTSDSGTMVLSDNDVTEILVHFVEAVTDACNSRASKRNRKRHRTGADGEDCCSRQMLPYRTLTDWKRCIEFPLRIYDNQNMTVTEVQGCDDSKEVETQGSDAIARRAPCDCPCDCPRSDSGSL